MDDRRRCLYCGKPADWQHLVSGEGITFLMGLPCAAGDTIFLCQLHGSALDASLAAPRD